MNENPTTYFQHRMNVLGVTPENNAIALWENVNENNEHKDVLVDRPIFKELPEGIEIIVYNLDRQTIRIQKNGSRMKKNFSIVRLEKPTVRPDGSVMKYRLPKGAGTHPFFPPGLVEKFEKKEQIDTLFLTEGYFKAFKSALSGIDMIGLSSITHMKDDTGKLHSDIKRLMIACQVKRIVWLTDGDALDITQKELKEAADLSKRPKNFFNSVITFKTLLDDFEDVEKWFFHIDTDSILTNNHGKLREDVKGIDDLLVNLPEKTAAIVADIQSVNSGTYFQKFNISYSTSKVYNHFHLRDVKDFYLFHVERRPELKNTEFIFNGTRFLYNEQTNECDVRIPGAAKLYFRVADDYYKFISIPNQFEKHEKIFQSRQKSTIKDDHPDKNFLKHIPKYEAFCNVPSHINFQPVISNCFNVYSPLDYFPDDEECFKEDCPTIMAFIHHIFGDRTASYVDPETKEKKEYTSMELGLDYLQLQYQKPSQKLPILCLVSRENATGKSTMANFLRMMLGANVAIVGNSDLMSDFNAHWASKSVVVCDETKIDKQHVIEKIKSLSTAKKIFMNAKGRGQVELDCFIKFVLITNNEDNFISVSDEDIRYWIIKVPKLQVENPNILESFDKEMPAFLSYISKRKMATEHKNRMWFHPSLLETEARRKVIAHSQTQVEKEMRYYLKELFLDTGAEEIWMTTTAVHKEIFKNSTRYEGYYLSRIIKDNLKAETYHVWKVEGIDKEYATEAEAIAVAEQKFPDSKGHMIYAHLKKHSKVVRHSYPKMEEKFEGGKRETMRVEVSDNGRPFIFKRRDFVREEDNVIVDQQNQFISEMTENEPQKKVAQQMKLDDDQPF